MMQEMPTQSSTSATIIYGDEGFRLQGHIQVSPAEGGSVAFVNETASEIEVNVKSGLLAPEGDDELDGDIHVFRVPGNGRIERKVLASSQGRYNFTAIRVGETGPGGHGGHGDGQSGTINVNK